MTECDFEYIGNGNHRCRNPLCSRMIKHVPRDTAIHATCFGGSGFGDWVARLLAWFGIYKHRGCKCSARQKTLNRIGWRFHPFLVAVYFAFIDVWRK